MAREFVMGARLELHDSFSRPMSDAASKTAAFQRTVDTTSTSISNVNTKGNMFKNIFEELRPAVDHSTQALDRQTSAAARMANKQAAMRPSVDRTTSAMERQGAVASKLGSAFKGLGVAAMGYFGFKAMTAQVSTWIDTAKEQIRAEERLKSLMLNVPGNTMKGVKAVQNYAGALQQQTTIGAEVTQAGASQMATFQLQASSIQKLLPTLQDLGVASYGANVNQEQMIQSGNLIGKVLAGQTGALSRVGINFSKTQEKALKFGNEQQRVATLIEVVNANVGGLAKSMRNTDEGKVAALGNTLADFRRSLGENILPLVGELAGISEKAIGIVQPAALGMIKAVMKTTLSLKQAANWVKGEFNDIANSNTFQKIKAGAVNAFNWITTVGVPAVVTGFMAIKDKTQEVVQYFTDNFKTLAPYIIGVGSALLIYEGYLKMVALQTKIVTVATRVWNVVMKAGPIWLVVAAIGLLVGYLINLAGGWDVVKAKLLALWPVIVNAWKNIWATLQPILQMIGQKAVQIWQWLVQTVPPLLQQLWTLLTGWFTNIWAAISPLLTTIWTGIMDVFNAIKAFWDQWGGLITAAAQVYWAYLSSIFMSALSVIWTLVKGAFSVIYNVIAGAFGMISGTIQAAWAIISGIFSVALNLLSGNWSGAWDAMVNMLKGVWSGIKTFFGGLKTLFWDSGVAIIKTLVDGIKSMAMAPVKAITSVFKKVRQLLPFSDAKKGPLDSLTHNGGKIVSTIAEGVYGQSHTLEKAMNKTLDAMPMETRPFTIPNTFNNVTAPSMASQLHVATNLNIPTVPELFTTLHVATSFDGANTPSYAAETSVGKVNPAGLRTTNNSSSKSIRFGDIHVRIDGSKIENIEDLADNVIDVLHKKLEAADEILGGDWGALL